MKDTLWHRFGFWLERFDFLHPLLFRRGNWGLYENRINGHLVRKEDRL